MSRSRNNVSRNALQKSRLRALQIESLEGRRLLAGDTDFFVDPSRLIFLGGSVEGTKWEDTNGNGRREDGEPGLAGVTIYADQNGNGQLERDVEQWVQTTADDPNTRIDEGGRYQMLLSPGQYTIREIVPTNFRQTFPMGVHNGNGEFVSINPSYIKAGEPGMVTQQTIQVVVNGECEDRPLELDVISEGFGLNPETGVDIINLSGPQINHCGGEVTEFDLEIIVFEPNSNLELGILDLPGGDVVASAPILFDGFISDPDGSPVDAPGIRFDGGHFVSIEQGSNVGGLDFGNQRIVSPGSIEGRTWLDADGNGRQDPNEVGLGGVEVYLDRNDNGRLDPGEPVTVTRYEDPVTDFDEGGIYSFGGMRPGDYVVRQIVPRGYEQTSPQPDALVLSSDTGKFVGGQGRAVDFDITDVDLVAGEDGGATTIEVSVEWPDGCGEFLPEQTSHAVIGNTILVDVHAQQLNLPCIQAFQTESLSITVNDLKPGVYNVVGTLHEEMNGEENTSLGVAGEIQLGPNGSHRITVEEGQLISGLDFGNRRMGNVESIRGMKWNDLNGDGQRQRDEPGLGGVTIYADLDHNGMFNAGEPSTTTAVDGDQLGTYSLELGPGTYAIREMVPEGFHQTFPGAFFNIQPVDLPAPIPFDPFDPLPPIENFESFHFVELSPGTNATQIDFGNQSTEPGAIHGMKWNDINGDGRRSDDEPGLAGVTIFVDLNYNGQLDNGEPSTVSMQDNASTAEDETGRYWLDDLKPGSLAVTEIVPAGYTQTFPSLSFPLPLPFPEPEFVQDPAGIRPAFNFGAHLVNLLPGATLEKIDFGNQELKPGSIHGLKWLDENGNGTREDSEPGLAGVTIYADANFNLMLDEGEAVAVTMSDDPNTAQDETGRYWLNDLPSQQSYQIREIVPAGYQQTFPYDFWLGLEPEKDALVPFPGGSHFVYLGSGMQVDEINFGNQLIQESGRVEGTKWEDINGNGVRDNGEPGIAGFRLFSDLNLNGRFDGNEPSAVTQRDDPSTAADETGRYAIDVSPGEHLILEVPQPGFEQIHPSPLRRIMFPYNLGDLVSVSSGETTTGVDFGNRKIVFGIRPDSNLGDDPHAAELGDQATQVKLSGGQLQVSSYVDHDSDVDVFQFIGNGSYIEGEGGGLTSEAEIHFELLDHDGGILAAASQGAPLATETVAGDTYYLRVSGAQGQYVMQMFDADSSAPVNTERSAGDINGDDNVLFDDFLILAANFEQKIDAAFADGDLTGDGQVTFEDFLILSANFGS